MASIPSNLSFNSFRPVDNGDSSRMTWAMKGDPRSLPVRTQVRRVSSGSLLISSLTDFTTV